MNGLLLVDKPGGLTSFDVVRKARRWCATRQIGHCGTLDPMATGVLPVAVGSVTRLVEYLMDGDKEYIATLRLGMVTDSQDSSGQLLETHPWEGVTRAAIESAVTGFVGTISQLPPMHSALKRDGVPLYRLAHQGIEIEREPREVRIDSIEILEIAPPLVTLRVTCGKGTYIRTLCHDLGRVLGCGACMSALRRTRCGAFGESQCHSVESLEDLAAHGSLPLIDPAGALANWPAFQVRAEALARLANGIAPTLVEVAGDAELADQQPVRLLVGDALAAVGCYPAAGEGGFKLWKVFPDVISPS